MICNLHSLDLLRPAHRNGPGKVIFDDATSALTDDMARGLYGISSDNPGISSDNPGGFEAGGLRDARFPAAALGPAAV